MLEQTGSLSLLALDGGGVRGLSSLLILRRLMEAIDSHNPPKPCDVFDMIGGTSTGGIIAIMLGRLRMSVDECIERYIRLSDTVFKKTSYLPVRVDGRVKARFGTKALEQVVKQTVADYLPQEGQDALHKDSNLEEGQCKVFVCTTSSSDITHTTKLSSYLNPRRSNDLLSTTKIWEAVRATSAASTFFDPITLGPFGELFTDGATGANNPVRELWTEAGDVWHHLGPLNTSLKCIVSVGTGQSGVPEFGDSLVDVAKALKQLAVETERTAEKFSQEHSDLVNEDRYFRLNVGRALQGIGLEEASKVPEIAGATRAYLSSEAVADLVQRCANSLRERSASVAKPASKTGSSAVYARSLVHSIHSGSQSYQSLLLAGARRLRPGLRDRFLSATRLIADQTSAQRISISNLVSPARPTQAHETAARLVGRLDVVMKNASSTLTTLDAEFSPTTLTKGAIVTSLTFCLRTEVYFQPVAKWIGLVLSFLEFLTWFTLEHFPVSSAVQAVFLNTYCYLWLASQHLADFFLDDFDREIQMSHDVRWHKRWQPVEHILSAVQSVVSSDAAFAIHSMSTLVSKESSLLFDMERARGQIMDQLSQMDEAAERERLTRRRKVIDWVSQLEYDEMQRALHDVRLKGTGSWLLQTAEFERWFQEDTSGILWCFGNPGVGKTILCSAVQDYLSDVFKEDARVGFAFVYCSFREPQTPSAYILSYLRQLLSQLPRVPAGVQERYDELYKDGKRLTQEDVELPHGRRDQMESGHLRLFAHVVEEFDKVHLSFDALDECGDREKWLLPFICRLVQRYKDDPSLKVTLKLFVTSRLQRDIELAFSAVSTIQVRARNVDGDIAAYIDYEFEQRSKNNSIGPLHTRLHDYIKVSLTSRANGMFLWAKYQLDIVFEQFTKDGIIETLNDLPETLYEHYDRVLNIIGAQSKPVRKLAQEALCCVAGSLRRLQGSELIAMIFGFRGPEANSSVNVDPIRIIQACHNLLVAFPDGTIGFAHYSVLEYLTSEHLQGPETGSNLRKYALDLDECRLRVTFICLRCLAAEPGQIDSLKPYAEQATLTHLRLVSSRNLRDQSFVRLFVACCVQYYMSESPIQKAAELGLGDLLEALLESGEYRDMQDLERAFRVACIHDSISHRNCQMALLRHGVHAGAASPLVGTGTGSRSGSRSDRFSCFSPWDSPHSAARDLPCSPRPLFTRSNSDEYGSSSRQPLVLFRDMESFNETQAGFGTVTSVDLPSINSVLSVVTHPPRPLQETTNLPFRPPPEVEEPRDSGVESPEMEMDDL